MRRVSAFVSLLSLVGVSQVICSTSALAAVGDFKDFSIHQHYISARAMGMGGAFVAAADDATALFYNPAGLANLGESHVNLSLAQVGADSKLPKLSSDINAASSTNNIADMVSLLESNYGNHYSVRVGALQAIWARPRWALAVIPVDLNLEMEIHQTVGPQLAVVAHQDTTIAYGRGWKLNVADGSMSVGATGKAIYRGYYNKSISAIELAFDSNILKKEDVGEGLTFDFDLGWMWKPNIPQSGFWSWIKHVKPTVGATVRNAVDYGFKTNMHVLDKNSREPAKLQRRLDVGTMFELPDWWIWRTRFVADLRDIGHENFTVKKGTHMGVEFLWKLASWWQGGWRAGINQGYFTAGFNGDFALFRLDLVTYANEVGTSSSPKASRVYMAKASLDF